MKRIEDVLLQAMWDVCDDCEGGDVAYCLMVLRVATALTQAAGRRLSALGFAEESR